jgi:hypothetical protein
MIRFPSAVDRIRAGKSPFPVADKKDPERVGEAFDAGISYLREVARILAVLYGTTNLGNKEDPTDELVYIILSPKTPEKAYLETFSILKARFPMWDDLLDVPRKEVERLVSPGGAGREARCGPKPLPGLRVSCDRCSSKPRTLAYHLRHPFRWAGPGTSS